MNLFLRRLAVVVAAVVAMAFVAMAGCEHIQRAVEPW